MRTLISAFTSMIFLGSAALQAATLCPHTVPVEVTVTARTYGKIVENNGVTHWAYTDGDATGCGRSPAEAHDAAEYIAARRSRDAHRDRLVQTGSSPNSQRDWLWGVATSDWTWHNEYFVRNIDWSGWITTGCRSLRNGSSYCGFDINNSQLTWNLSGSARLRNNPQGF